MAEPKTDLESTQAQTYDSQQLSEEIATGETKVPKVNVDADYNAAQEFSSSEIDQTRAGDEAAAAAVAPQHEVPAPEETTFTAEPTGNPDEFIDIAKEVSPFPSGSTNVTDELVQKAIDKSQPVQ
ncbi:MAG: hypothetical protein VKJ46_16555 [Leptolyngbyaceae bacterium]|nr:hypothetical protein [Leptolyngbyaceae bacterium]